MAANVGSHGETWYGSPGSAADGDRGRAVLERDGRAAGRRVGQEHERAGAGRRARAVDREAGAAGDDDVQLLVATRAGAALVVLLDQVLARVGGERVDPERRDARARGGRAGSPTPAAWIAGMSSMCLMRGASGMAGIISGVQLPDTLVLGAGGTLGEAWMRGVITGLEAASGLDFRDCEYVLGTSAGLDRRRHAGVRAPARGRRPRGAGVGRGGGRRDGVRRAGSPRGARGVPVRHGRRPARWRRSRSPGSRRPAGFARSAALSAAPATDAPARTRSPGTSTRSARSSTAACGSRRSIARSGARVLFGAPGAPTAGVRDAVLASCAVPWLFAPVEIDGREYVDGGVWSPINLDAAPGGRGAHVLCLAPTAGAGPFRAVTGAALIAEEMALRARGMRLRTVVPDADSVAAIGPNLMARDRVEAVVDAGFAQGLALARSA